MWIPKGGTTMTPEERNTLATTPRMYFDTRHGINMMFQEKPETALQEVSHLRRLFEELNPGAKELHEFVVCGEYLLDMEKLTISTILFQTRTSV